jgi:Cd2+/Zn2+-exporting ATPase
VVGGRLVGLIALRDEPRLDAKSALAALQDLGIRSAGASLIPSPTIMTRPPTPSARITATLSSGICSSHTYDVVEMIRLARAAMANIRQNIAVALGLKAV